MKTIKDQKYSPGDEPVENKLEAECEMRSELKKLFGKWKNEISKKHGDWKFLEDGFYPCYTQMPIKILFLGRESRGIAEQADLIDAFYPSYCLGRIGGKDQKGRYRTIGQTAFHRRIFKMASVVLNGNVQQLSKLITDFKDGTLSFAFANISKITNFNVDSYSSNYSVIESFVKDSCCFLKNEMEILQPHLIVGANVIGDRMIREADVKDFGFEKKDPISSLADVYVKSSGQVFVNMKTHFSALKGCSDEKTFCMPLNEAVGKWRQGW